MQKKEREDLRKKEEEEEKRQAAEKLTREKERELKKAEAAVVDSVSMEEVPSLSFVYFAKRCLLSQEIHTWNEASQDG